MDNWHLVVIKMRDIIAKLETQPKKTWRDRYALFCHKRTLKNLERTLATLVEEGRR